MAITDDEILEKITNLTYLQELLDSTLSDASDAYEVLNNYDDVIKYILSLNYLNMSHQSFLEFKRVYHQYGLEHTEIDSFVTDYEHFKFQLKEVITKRDSNTSWLISALDKLGDTKKYVNEFLSDWIKNNLR